VVITPLKGKGMMLLALVLFTESVTLTKAVRSVQAFGGSSSNADSGAYAAAARAQHEHESCSDASSSASCVAASPAASLPPILGKALDLDCCAEFQKCTTTTRNSNNANNSPRAALEECVLALSRGGGVATAAAEATAALANKNTPLQIPLYGWKILFQALLTTINVVCWLVPLRSKSFGENKLALGLANAFSGGIFLSLAFGHMIPECVQEYAHSAVGDYNEATPYMLVLSGYLLIFFVEKVAFDAHEIMNEMEQGGGQAADKNKVSNSKQSGGSNGGETTSAKNTGRSAMILLAALGVHSILEMMALGLSDSFSDSAILTISIALHQPAESIALLVAFLKSGMPKRQIITFLSIFSAMGPIGVALGMAVNEFAAPIVDAIMLAVVAGTFVYVGATEVIPEEWEDSEHKFKKFFALMGGIISIFAITQYTQTLGV